MTLTAMTHAHVDRRTLLAGGAAGVGLALAGSTVAAAPAEATHRLLRRGDRGRDVYWLQRQMAGLGYWCGRADGVFGPLTQQAVWAVQKAGGVTRDGVVGPVTRRILDRDVVPRPSHPYGRHIEVDLSRQLLLEVRYGRTRMVLNTSTGHGGYYWWNGRRHRAYTPTGWFRVYSTYSAGWQYGPLGALYRPQYFYKGWAVHGSGSIPPWPASHGCCRVSTSAMNRLWATGAMRDGRRVIITR